MKAFHCDRYPIPVTPRHRFPLDKYARLRETLENLPRLDLEIVESPRISQCELELAHRKHYIDRVIDGRLSAEEQRVLGFPWSKAFVERALRSVGGTVAACRSALTDWASVNLAGGTHHAKSERAAGYCMFNDVAIAAQVIHNYCDIDRVLIVDADVHQGDGTAEILQNFPHLYTFSIHAAGNFPYRKMSSDLDVALADGMGDAGYLRSFRDGVERAFLAARPNFVIYLAGADPYSDDRLGKLNLTKPGLRERDEVVFDACRLRRVPIAAVMAGGYARNIDDIVQIHAQTVELAVHYAETFKDIDYAG